LNFQNAPISRTRALLLAAFAVLLAVAALIVPASAAPRKTVDIQILNVSDWHGQLDPNNGVGGAAVLSAYFQQERVANPNTLTLTAGDAVGATPPLSGFFDDVPAIKAMRLMGFDADTVGNHNFDSGLARLQSQIELAGSTTELGKPFTYLSANLKNVDENVTGIEKMKIFNVGGVKVAVIGLTNPEAPGLVFPGNFGTIEITDPVAAANRTRAVARKAGAQVVIGLIHAGITVKNADGSGTGPLVDFANGVTGFDLILGDHTDFEYEATINGALVTENKSKGAKYSKTKITVDPAKGVIAKSVQFVTPLASAVMPDQAVVDMLAPYRAELAKAYDGKIGVATGVFPRGGTPAVERVGEVAIGNLVTDAMRWKYGTQLALTNGGGLRSTLPSSYKPIDTSLRRNTPGYAAGPPYDLVIGDVYEVLPFGNSVVTRSVTGTQLWAVLEHSVGAIPAANGRFGQISGFKFSYDATKPVGLRVVSVTLDNGTPIPADATTYTLATNDFTNAGGDGYTMLADGQGVTRNLMANDLLDYIKDKGTISPTIEGRITKLP
jgi:5'-nucleotidase